MDYAEFAEFARSWGLVYLLILFAGVVAYVLWPRNRKKFRDAAHIPLKDE